MRGIPSPGSFWKLKKRRAAGWVHTTLVGSHSKASGILRNPIYAGAVTWNKRRGKKFPGTSQRIQHRRPESEWITHADESVRIISNELFEEVRKRLKMARKKVHANNKGGRPAKYLFSGLLKCAACGGHYVLYNGRQYRCSSNT